MQLWTWTDVSANRCPPYRQAVARPKSPGRAPERARSTHRARVDAGRSAEGQMSPALRALGRWRGVIVWLHSPSRAQTLMEMQAVKRKCVCNNEERERERERERESR